MYNRDEAVFLIHALSVMGASVYLRNNYIFWTAGPASGNFKEDFQSYAEGSQRRKVRELMKAFDELLPRFLSSRNQVRTPQRENFGALFDVVVAQKMNWALGTLKRKPLNWQISSRDCRIRIEDTSRRSWDQHLTSIDVLSYRPVADHMDYFVRKFEWVEQRIPEMYDNSEEMSLLLSVNRGVKNVGNTEQPTGTVDSNAEVGASSNNQLR